VEGLGVEDDFFALGGDSMLSIRVVHLARSAGIWLTVQDLFSSPTIAALAPARMQASHAPPRAPYVPFSLVPGGAPSDPALDDAYPVGRLQAGMLFESELNPELGRYRDLVTFQVHGQLDVGILDQAFEDVIARHPILRTSFSLHRFAVPMQLVHRHVDAGVQVTDLRDLPEEVREARLASWLRTEKRTPFDPGRPCLLRLHVTRQADDAFLLTLSWHHAILDGWSAATLVTELFNRYVGHRAGAAPPVESLRVSYGEYVRLELEALGSPETTGYWRDLLEGSTATALPAAEGIVAATHDLATYAHDVELSAEVGEALIALARSLHVPLKSVLLAAHCFVIGRVGGTADVVTGLVTHGRPEEADGDAMLGLFLNTLPLRLSLRGGTWTDLIRDAFRSELAALPHRRYPQSQIMRDVGGAPNLPTAFNFNHFHVYDGLPKRDDLVVVGVAAHQQTELPLITSASLSPVTGRVSLTLYHRADIGRDRVRRLGEHYRLTIDEMVARPGARHDRFAPLTPEETERLGRLPPGGVQRAPIVPRSIAEQAAVRPEATAVVHGTRRLSYRQLVAAASTMAARLAERGVRRGDLVAICAMRSLEQIVAALAVHWAGAGYVPVDPRDPPERRSAILRDAGVRLLLTDVDIGVPDVDERAAWPPAVAVDACDVAYVLYTSGSTGRPKGVLVEHGQVASYVCALIDALGLAPGETFAMLQPLTVDSSVTALYAPLASGGCVHVIDEEVALDGALLDDYLADNAIDNLKIAPSHLSALHASGSMPMPRRRLVVGGEPSQWAQARVWAAASCAVFNHYGPTETTVGVLVHRVDADRDVAPGIVTPLGSPLRNSRVHVLDDLMRLVPLGTPGEIYIGGEGVARGYLGDPGLTAERFVADPFGPPGRRLYRSGDRGWVDEDGQVRFLGRADDQVKVRGHRIEPAEVEAAIRGVDGVRDALVLVRDDPRARRVLVAYIVPSSEGLSIDEVRTALAARLPNPMLPGAYVLLDDWPRTSHGKVDRPALPSPDMSGVGPDSTPLMPRTPTERRIAEVWREVLGVDRVGVEDQFFRLGGHSLLAMEIVARVRAEFDVAMPLRTIFEAPTVAGMAERISELERERRGSSGESGPDAVSRPAASGRYALTDAQLAYHLVGGGGAGASVYTEFQVPAGVADLRERIESAVRRLVRRHDALRVVFDGDRLQRILPDVPDYHVVLDDRSGLGEDAARAALGSTRRRMQADPAGTRAWPPFEVRVTRLPGEDRLHTRFDAAIFDGRSRGILHDELFDILDDPERELEPLDYSWRDHLEHELSEAPADDDDQRHWDDLAAMMPPPPRLPVSHDGRGGCRYSVRESTLPAACWERLKTRAASAGLTPSAVVIAAFVDTVAEHTRTPAFTIGLNGARRPPVHPRIDDIVGTFATITLVSVVERSGSFANRARRLQVQVAADRDHDHPPGYRLLRMLARRRPGDWDGGMPVSFTSLLTGIAPVRARAAPREWPFRVVASGLFSAGAWLKPQVGELPGGALLCRWQSRDDVYPEAQMSRMLDAFIDRLRSVEADDGAWTGS